MTHVSSAQDPGTGPIGIPSAALPAWSRNLAWTTAVLFLISTLFPVIAGLSKDTAAFSRWFGVADVALAFLVIVLALVIWGLAQGKVSQRATDATYRAYRILIHGILVLCIGFFLFGDRIVWINCLTGFAWRSWLLMYSLPAWFTASGTTVSGEPSLGSPN